MFIVDDKTHSIKLCGLSNVIITKHGRCFLVTAYKIWTVL